MSHKRDSIVSLILIQLIEMTKSKIMLQTLMIVIIVLGILFMILPTVNMVNLNISRIMERASEIGVRKSFGAPSTTSDNNPPATVRIIFSVIN